MSHGEDIIKLIMIKERKLRKVEVVQVNVEIYWNVLNQNKF